MASIKKKSNYSVPDYLGALVGDFIRGKKLQEEEREQREKNESEENFASLVSQRMNVILPIQQCETKTHGRKPPVKEKTTKQNKNSMRRIRRDWRRVCNHLLDAVVKKGQTRVLVTDKSALLDEADEDLGLGELGVEFLVGTVSAF